MDFANSTNDAPADSLPPMGCLSSHDHDDDASGETSQGTATSARSGIRLRLPPFYVLQPADVPRLGRKSN